MPLDRVRRDKEEFGDFLVAEPPFEQQQHVQFTVAQHIGSRRRVAVGLQQCHRFVRRHHLAVFQAQKRRESGQ